MIPSFVYDMIAEGIALEQDLDERWWDFALKTLEREEAFKPDLRSLFSAQEYWTLNQLEFSPPEPKAIKADPAEYETWLFKPEEWYFQFEVMARGHVTDSMASAGNDALVEVGVGIEFDVTNPRIERLIDEKLHKFSFEVNDTTIRALRREFNAGLDAGEGIYGLRKRVERVFGIAKKSRTERIARTEIIGTANKGTFEGYVASDVVETKIWIETRDRRTRDSHRSSGVGGEEVGLKKKFSNGLMHPGDWSGPASEIINCRCALGAGKLKE